MGGGEGGGAVTTRAYFMRSARLGFSTWHADDGDLAAAIWGDPLVTKLTGGPFSPAQVAARMAREIATQDECGFQYWPIFRLGDDNLVGCCGLRPRLGEAEVCELGYQLRVDAWGQGYATEAARRAIDWAAANGCASLIAGHNPANLASKHILIGLGFTYSHDELYPPTGEMEPCYRLSPRSRQQSTDGAA